MLEEDEATAAQTTQVWVLWHQEPLVGRTHCPRKVDEPQCPAAPHVLTVTVTGKDKAFVWIHQGRGPGWRYLSLQAYLPTCHKFLAFLVRSIPLSRLVCPQCGLDTKTFWLSLQNHVRAKHFGRGSVRDAPLSVPKRPLSFRAYGQEPHRGFPVRTGRRGTYQGLDAHTKFPVAATGRDEAVFRFNGRGETGWQHLPRQAYLHAVQKIIASLAEVMPRSRSACPVCGLDTSKFWLSLKDHLRTKHLGRRPLHRTYNLSSPRRLKLFLAFLAYEIENVRSHPHFEELSQWATNTSIFWKGDGGQMIEKLVHLVINTHVVPCTKEKCMVFKLRVNFDGNWSAYTTEACRKCQAKDQMEGPVITWHLEDFVTWAPDRFSPSLSAELVTLLLNPSACWRPQPGRSVLGDPMRQSLPRGGRPPIPSTCATCGKQQLERKDYASEGPFFIMVTALIADICTCGFECIWGL